MGGSLYYSPGAFVPDIEFSPQVLILPRMWAARQIAIALIIGYSTIKQSIPMLKISLTAYCLMTLQDIAIGLVQKDIGLAMGSLLFCILSGSMIYVLSRKGSGIQ